MWYLLLDKWLPTFWRNMHLHLQISMVHTDGLCSTDNTGNTLQKAGIQGHCHQKIYNNLYAGSLQLLMFQNAYSKMWWASYVQEVHWSSQSLWSWCFLHHRSAQMNHLHTVVTQQSCWQCVVWQLCREHTANPQTHIESRDRPTQPHQAANWAARSPSTVSKANSSIIMGFEERWHLAALEAEGHTR